MLENIVDLLSVLVVVSFFGMLVSIKPLLTSLNNAQRFWFLSFIFLSIFLLIFINIPDFITGLLYGISK